MLYAGSVCFFVGLSFVCLLVFVAVASVCLYFLFVCCYLFPVFVLLCVCFYYCWFPFFVLSLVFVLFFVLVIVGSLSLCCLSWFVCFLLSLVSPRLVLSLFAVCLSVC